MTVEDHNRGFSLIEVMLALLILAVGILGISKLQGTLIKNTSDANQRAVAVALAQKKIDDLRSFAQMDMTGVSDWACPGTPLNAASLAYADIADDAGGAPLCDANLVANSNIDIGNTNYQLSWDVTPYEFVTNVATLMPDASTASPTVDFKNVQVMVSWMDIDTGNDASVALSTILDAYSPALTAITGSNSAGGAPIYTTYTPELAPDVIDVEVNTGDGTKRQTSKPLPDAVSQGQNANTIVTFEVVTYQENPIDPTLFTQTRREEFTTVDCKCTLSATDGTAYPPAHSVWDDVNKERYDYVASAISKPTATPSNNVNAVNEVCTVCCRDHHDDDASLVKYVAGTTSGNHDHYLSNGSGDVAGPGDEYIESCRIKLVDGVARVYQDWNLIDFTVLRRSQLTDGSPLQSQYTTYAAQSVLDEIESTSLAVKPASRTPITLPVGSLEQMESRGIYIDKVYDLTGTESVEYATYVTDTNNADRLEKVPFAEVNLSLLSNWTSATPALVSVTDEAVATISDPANDYYGSYSRGLLETLAAAPAPGVDITSSILPGNDGITQMVVDPSPPSSLSDTVAVIVDGVAASPITISGSIDGSGLPGGTKFNITGCSISQGGGGKNFECTKASGSDVSITVTASYEVTTGSGQNKITTTVNCLGTFNQEDVETDITGVTISLTCS